MTTARSLRALADPSGFSAADIAFLTGLEESTISRLWDDPDWLDRIKGQSLQALIAVLPGVADYVCRHSLASRRTRLMRSLGDAGINVNRSVFQGLISKGIPEQHLANALQAASHILNGNISEAAGHLARFWAANQDYALTCLYAPSGDEALLADTNPLVAASVKLAAELASRPHSFHALLGQATLSHHIARATGQTITARNARPIDRASAFNYRSTTIGLIIETDNVDIADRYANEVATTSLLSLIEAWAFPTYTRDAKPTADFSLPPSLLLRRTAAEILRELATYNDAYFYYLVATALPLILQRDPTFGLRAPELTTLIETRMSTAKLEIPVGRLLDQLHGANNDQS